MSTEDRRELLRAVSRSAKGGVVSVAEAAAAWDETTRSAALRLARYARQGWVARVRRGIYCVLPLESGANAIAEDPWILAQRVFPPCYIGGWSAAEHWQLTEQLFRSTFVVTAASIRKREQTLLGVTFRLARAAAERVETVSTVWRKDVSVGVSSPERTLVDAFVSPSWAGGVRHLAEMLRSYRDLPKKSEAALAGELQRHGNGAAHKRAGHLAERLWPEAEDLLRVASAGRSAGVIRLDPSVAARGRMNRRWGLWINVDVPKDEG